MTTRRSLLLSPIAFRRVYDRFQDLHVAKDGKPLERFEDRSSFAWHEERYKTGVVLQAESIIAATKSKRDLLPAVIRAIEIKENNLLQWHGIQGPPSKVHKKLILALENPADRARFESLFRELYFGRGSEERVFAGLVELCGKRYELIAYLFFVANAGEYLPIRTTTFDKLFLELDVDLKTAGKCSWTNYQDYLLVMRQVQVQLHAEGISDARLIDAHSFCWMVARLPRASTALGEEEFLPIVPFSGSFKLAQRAATLVPLEDSAVRDMHLEAAKRTAAGQVAEERALRAEVKRLLDAGAPSLASKVELVSNKPGLGYDIRSYESDGRERLIEVKNVAKSKRFFVSDGEWRNSRARPNYWFYLVGNSRIECVSADILTENHLTATHYLVEF